MVIARESPLRDGISKLAMCDSLIVFPLNPYFLMVTAPFIGYFLWL
jgi:hypothetical protein